MPLPILPEIIDRKLRDFMDQTQIGTDQLMKIISAAFDRGAEQDPDFEDEEPVAADATINVPDEELNPHPATELAASMTPQRARRLKNVGNMAGYKRVTTASQRRHIRRRKSA